MTEVQCLRCTSCGKYVSTAFTPVPTETPDKGLIVRAVIECPECIEKRAKSTVEVGDRIWWNLELIAQEILLEEMGLNFELEVLRIEISLDGSKIIWMKKAREKKSN